MKKLLLASSAFLAFAGTASAADLPSRKGPPIQPVYAAPAFSWTGLYVGLNAGYGWNTNKDDNRYGLGGFGGGSSDDGGFVGGGQIGYNYQINQFVVGAEADIQYADLKGKDRTYFDDGGNYYTRGGQGVEWFGTVRARLGFTPIDRLLIYGTGGFAYGGGGDKNSYGYDYGYASGYGRKSGDDVKAGWVVGGGVEYAFTPNLTAKLEGLYVNLGKQKNNYYDADFVYGEKKDLEFAVVRAGLNYKFDFGGGSALLPY